MTVTNNIYQKQIKYHVFNAVTNSELTELVPVFTIPPAFPTSVKKVNTSFKNVWRTWGPALPSLLADLMIFCPLGPMNFKNSEQSWMLLIKVSTHTFLTMIIEESVCFMSCEPFFWVIILMWYTRYIYIYFFIN